jgi:uncharacterized protein
MKEDEMSNQSIIQDVFSLARNDAQLTGQVSVASLTRLHRDLSDQSGALTYRVVGRVGDKANLFIDITIDGSMNMVCQRCLEPVSQLVAVDNTLQLVESEDELDNEEEELAAILAGDTSPEKIVGAKEFNIFDLLEDEVILSLPMSVTHETCGKQLPMSVGEKVSPFDALLKLKPE